MSDLQISRSENLISRVILRKAILVVLTLGFILLSACSRQSVVRDAGANSTPAPTTTQNIEASASSNNSLPSTTPTTQTTPTPADANRQTTTLKDTTGVVKSVYKPTPTPGDPFPPRPTPTIVMENGKIKQQWQAPPEALALVNPVKDRPDAAKIGAYFYNQRCADCHGKKGYGNGWMSPMVKKPPTNLASQMVQANTDGELYWKITNGRSPMPANFERFDDEQRWYIVTFLRTLK